MNHTRRALQQVWNRALRRAEPYPDFAATHCAHEQRELARLEEELHAAEGDDDAARCAELLPAIATLQSEISRRVRRLEVEFEKSHILVVEEWGGEKYPRAKWTYDLERCVAWCRGDRSDPRRTGARTGSGRPGGA